MGLDMYAFSVRKATEEEKSAILTCKTMTELKELQDKNNELHMLTPNIDNEEDMGLIDDILDYAIKVEVDGLYYSHEIIKKHFDIPENASAGGMTLADYIEFSYWDGDKRYTTRWEPNSKEEEKFIITEKTTVFIVYMKEVAYWRKCYTLRNIIYDILCNEDIEVENCGYYHLSNELWKEVFDRLEASFDNLDEDDSWRDYDPLIPNKLAQILKEDTEEESYIIYHEWY